MLSRTADHLFWMARYMERAENTARMLDVNYQTSLLPQSDDMAEQGWRGLLSISELTLGFSKKLEHLKHSVALSIAYYNFCRVHKSLQGETPAMAARLTQHVWSIAELLTESGQVGSEKWICPLLERTVSPPIRRRYKSRPFVKFSANRNPSPQLTTPTASCPPPPMTGRKLMPAQSTCLKT